MAFLKFLFYTALAFPHSAEIDEKIIMEIPPAVGDMNFLFLQGQSVLFWGGLCSKFVFGLV
jgi:hypothetical protein